MSNDPDACKEERYLAHLAEPSCAGCHASIDPIGLGLENYDVGGVFREHDEGRPECVISGEGSLPDGTSFSGPAQLATALVDGGTIEPCAVEHYLAYAYGRPLLAGEGAQVDAVLTTFADQGYSFAGLLTELVGDEVFAYRKEPE
jgi:hypothetical protein